MSEKAPLIWLDMEMTGLDPETCVPIEVAIVVTDKDLVELGHYSTAIWQPTETLERMEPIVRQMHTKNGLLEKVMQAPTSLGQAQRKMSELVLAHAGFRRGVLAGNSIHQDRRFLVRYFPVFEGLLHYRMIDVSSIKELATRWYPPSYLPGKSEGDHTALSDIRGSIKELKHYRQSIFKTHEA